MSYPRTEGAVPSVNSLINSDDFPTAWGTFTHTSEMILELPPGARAATFDISAAYRITPVRPAQQNALCIYWRGKIYIDRAVMFGLTSSAGVFGAVADMLVAIYRAAGFHPICKWVDDFFVIQLPGQTWSEEDFICLTAKLGVPWATEKTRPLASLQQYIGFIWDLEEKTVSLPPGKRAATLTLIEAWLRDQARFTAHEAASLHGKLVHTSCIYPLIRPFIRSAAVFANSFRSPMARLNPPRGLTQDLKQVRELLGILPAELPLSDPVPYDINWWGDASSSFGIGVTVGGFWGVWRWAPNARIGPQADRDIGWAEAVAVELGLRMAIHHGLVAGRPVSQSRILVRSDNTGVVAVVRAGRSRS